MVNEAAKNEFWTWNIKLVREIERGRFWIDCNWFPDLVHIIRNYILLKESERVILHWLNWTLNDHLQHQLKNVNCWNKKCFIDGYNDDRCNYLLHLSCLYAEKDIWIIILTRPIQMVKYIFVILIIKKVYFSVIFFSKYWNKLHMSIKIISLSLIIHVTRLVTHVNYKFVDIQKNQFKIICRRHFVWLLFRLLYDFLHFPTTT